MPYGSLAEIKLIAPHPASSYQAGFSSPEETENTS
jgi:hypothetical protein